MHPSFPDCNLTLHVQQVQKDHHVLRHTVVVPRKSSVVQTFELTLPQQLLRQLLQQLAQGLMTGRGPMSFGRATPSAISGVILRPPRLTANAANTQASHCPPVLLLLSHWVISASLLSLQLMAVAEFGRRAHRPPIPTCSHCAFQG